MSPVTQVIFFDKLIYFLHNQLTRKRRAKLRLQQQVLGHFCITDDELNCDFIVIIQNCFYC